MEFTVEITDYDDLIDFFKNNKRKLLTAPYRTVAQYIMNSNNTELLNYIPDKSLKSVFEWYVYILENHDWTGHDAWFDQLHLFLDKVKGQISNTSLKSLTWIWNKTRDEKIVQYLITYFNTTRNKKELSDLAINRPYYYGNWTQELYKRIIVAIDNPLEMISGKEEQKLYEEALHGAVLDTSIGLRGAGLPSLVVDNIASHLYDTSGFDAYKIVQSVNEKKF